ncbi:MAG: DUF523 domain-containing protein, partial [Rhodobacteraceae bacterium]|nr:DUF523 domain-containing protein [Paracoccaceae bacterium]
YDGRGKPLGDARLAAWQAQGRIVALCPEVAGRLPTPRPPAEIEPGATALDVLEGRARILTATGADVTAPFLAGARIALHTAQAQHCRFALLMDGSPSCGSLQVYSGHHDGTRQPGQGVTAALLVRHGITVFAPSQIDALATLAD